MDQGLHLADCISLAQTKGISAVEFVFINAVSLSHSKYELPLMGNVILTELKRTFV